MRTSGHYRSSAPGRSCPSQQSESGDHDTKETGEKIGAASPDLVQMDPGPVEFDSD